MSKLKSFFKENILEAGCDEAGRGALAGPVYAAAVIFPPKVDIPILNDSKLISAKKRYQLRTEIESKALAFFVGFVDHIEIDKTNILRAAIKAMHIAIAGLTRQPQHLIIDGNKFYTFQNIPHHCIIKGDQKYKSIAAASILAKTYRDDFMIKLHEKFPVYNWKSNKGYATLEHRNKIKENGYSPFHRRSFRLKDSQLSLL